MAPRAWDWELAAGDTWPPLRFTFSDERGTDWTLNGTAVTFLSKDAVTGEIVHDRQPCEIVDADNRVVDFPLEGQPFPDPGDFFAKFTVVSTEASHPNETQEIPSGDNWLVVHVTPS